MRPRLLCRKTNVMRLWQYTKRNENTICEIEKYFCNILTQDGKWKVWEMLQQELPLLTKREKEIFGKNVKTDETLCMKCTGVKENGIGKAKRNSLQTF